MIRLAFCYSKISKWSFLDSTLGLSDLKKLRFNKETYEQILEQQKVFEDTEFVYLYDDLPNTLQKLCAEISSYLIEHNIYLDADDSVAVLDLTYFPCDLKLFTGKLAQAAASSLPLVITSSHRDHEYTDVLFKAKNLKAQSLPLDVPVFTAPEGFFTDLNVPSEIMDLFNSGLVLRNFNSMKVGRVGYFFKHSMQRQKMKAEHEFLDNLPTAIRPFFPCCGDYKEFDDGSAGYEIELVPTLDVAKFLINNYFSSAESSRRLLNSIETYLDAVPRKDPDLKSYRDALMKSFVEKGEQRLQDMTELACIERLNQIARLFGFESAESFGGAYLELLQTSILKLKDPVFCYSHGDLFFGNMLYDPAKQVLKLIDPKGGSGEQCWQPVWYDLAKLSHSFMGNYDLMVYGLITPVMNEDLNLSLKVSPEFEDTCHYLADEFRNFLKRRHIDINLVRLFEGSLFLSMIPLHNEAPLRMSCQLIRAIEIYQEVKSKV